MHFLRAALLVLALSIPSAAQIAKPNFFARVDAEGTGCLDYYVLLIGDLNGDGFPDLVCMNVLLGNGDGTFKVGQYLNPGAGSFFYATLADVYGDGKLDVVLPTNIKQIAILRGNGDGTFQNPVFVASPIADSGPWTVGVADFNGDGIPDVVEMGPSSGIVFAGSANGTFTAGPNFPVNSNQNQPSGSFVTDVNNDGHPDVVALYGGNLLIVLLGKGDGTFQAPINTTLPFPKKPSANAMAVGDVNGDGIPDVAVTNNKNTAILIGKGDGTFDAPQWVNLPGGNYGLTLADVNGDGILDLINNQAEVALGKGDGTFGRPVYWPVAPELGQGAVAAADLRNIGRNDLITTDGDFGSVLLNTGKGAFEDGIRTTIPGGNVSWATGDFNGDGVPDIVAVNALGLQIMLGTGKAGKPFEAGAAYNVINPLCPVVGDLNGDGIPDLFVPSGPFGGVGSVTAFLGNGDGTFRLGPIGSVPNVQTFALGDFNGDGKLDYATTSNLLAYGNGDGSFQAPAAYIPYISPKTVSGFTDVIVADLAGTSPDIILNDYAGMQLYVLYNQGSAGWNEVLIPTYFCASLTNLTAGYVDGGQGIDIAGATFHGLSAFLNNGTGTLTQGPCVAYDYQDYPGGFPIIADVNGDGVPDLTWAEQGDMAVFIGKSNGSFVNPALPLFFGTENSPVAGFALNTHHQSAKLGKPDLVEVDATGVIFTLINETK